MMLYAGIAACLILLAVSGWLAYRNSIIIAEKKQEPETPKKPSEYTLLKGNNIPPEEKSLVPLTRLTYREGGTETAVTLCRLDEAEGDLRLEEAEKLFAGHLRQAIQDGTYVNCTSNRHLLKGAEEINMVQRLEAFSG